MWWGVTGCIHYVYRRHLNVNAHQPSSVHLTKSFQDFDNNRVVRWLGRLLHYGFAVKHIKGTTNVVADALSHRPPSLSICAATVLVCDDFFRIKMVF